VGSALSSLALVRFAPARFTSKRFAPAEIRPDEARSGEVRSSEVRTDISVLVTPCVPGLHALLEQCDALVVELLSKK
jgi:hypothetical protein